MKLINFLLSIICFFVGHDEVPRYTEEDNHIYNKACQRCNCTIGMSVLHLWMPKCPGTTQEHWDEFLEERKRDIKTQVDSEIRGLKIIEDNQRRGVRCWYPIKDRTTTPPTED